MKIILILVFTLTTFFYTHISHSESLAIPLIEDSNINLDGILNEDSWSRALELDLGYETSPGNNIAAAEETTVYTFTDGESLFIGFVAFDSNGNRIDRSSRQRDNISDQDQVGIVIDTKGTSDEAYMFFVTPSGAILDSSYDERAKNENTAWDYTWYSQSKIDNNKYSVEIKIPLSRLISSSVQEQLFKIDFVRFQSRELRRRFSYVKLRRGDLCYLCQLKSFTLSTNFDESSVLSRTSKSVITGTAKLSERTVSHEKQGSESSKELGYEWSGKFSSSSELSLTLNPDFSQIESDVIRLDLNVRDAFYYDERRPFFVPLMNSYQMPVSLFYSRNIQDPDAAVKFNWSDGVSRLDIVSAKDNKTGFILPGDDFSRFVSLGSGQDKEVESTSSAIRYQSKIENFIYGVYLSNREADQYRNNLVSLDGQYSFTNNLVGEWQLSASDTLTPYPERENDVERGYLHHFDIRYSDESWLASISKRRISKNFRADLGFVSRENWSNYNASLQRAWRYDEAKFISEFRIGGRYENSKNLEGQLLYSEKASYFEFDAVQQTSLGLYYFNRERFYDDFLFQENLYELSLQTDITDDLIAGASFLYGDQVDYDNSRMGTTNEFSLDLQYEPFEQLQLNLGYSIWDFESDEARLFDAESINARLYYYFNNNFYIRVVMQGRNVNRDPSGYINQDNGYDEERFDDQILLAYRTTGRTLLYFGYSKNSYDERLNISDYSEQNDTYFVKFSIEF